MEVYILENYRAEWMIGDDRPTNREWLPGDRIRPHFVAYPNIPSYNHLYMTLFKPQ